MKKECVYQNLYVKTGLITFCALCLTYSFLLTQFIWGNHDWDFIKSSVRISDGLFEARYSQHFFTAFLFNGQVLPLLTLLTSFIALTLLTLIIATYVNLPKTPQAYTLFSLFIGLSPYNFVIFNYLYLSVPFFLWIAIAISGLFLSEPPFTKARFIIATIIYLLFLGAYPPAISLLCVAFLTKQLCLYTQKRTTFSQIIRNTLFLCLQFLTAKILHKGIIFILIQNKTLSQYAYNLQLNSLPTILSETLNQLSLIIPQFITTSPFIEADFITLSAMGIIAAVLLTCFSAPKDWKIYAFIFLMFLSTRLPFILSPFAQYNYFRIEYWGRFSIFVFTAATLLNIRQQFAKNIVYIWFSYLLALSVNTDFTIQKAWVLGFKAERLYHTRLLTTLITHPDFNPQKEYLFMNFGQPNFRGRFHTPALPNTYPYSELITYNALPCDLGHILFWEASTSPIALTAGFTPEGLLHAPAKNPHTIHTSQYWRNNPQNMVNFRLWLNQKAAIYPNKNAFYIDDRYIVLNSDRTNFYKNKELAARGLDQTPR